MKFLYNRKISKLLFINIFIILGGGCTKNQTNSIIIEKFPKLANIKGEPVKNINITSAGNVNLLCIDSFLVVQKKEDFIFQIYDTKSHKLLSEFGKKGRGPNEFIFPELINQISYDEGNNSPVVNVYDYTRHRFTNINIFNSIQNRPDYIFKSSRVPKTDKFLTYFFYRDDDLMVATPEDNYRFLIYKDSTNTFQSVPYIPETKFPIKKRILPLVYRSATFVNRKLGLIASAPILLGELDLFDLNGNLLSSSIFEKRENLFKDLSNLDEKNRDVKYHIVQLHANENYIYALNYDNYQNDFVKTKKFRNQSILVFDWKGNPVKKYILDKGFFIKSFAIDWNNNKIYGYCPDKNENSIIVYNCNLIGFEK